MVKQLIAKRKDKSLAVQDYWAIRQSLKTKKVHQKPIDPNMEERAKNRFRYEKHKDLVKAFNPLAILLDTKMDPEETHTQLLISNITTMPKGISKVRGYCLSLPLILHNLPMIFRILADNLDVEESWQLLIAILRDTGIEAFNIFLSIIPKLITNIDQNFNNSAFRRIFDLLSVFLQTNFTSITQNLQLVWQHFKQNLFEHPNKYLKKFSLQTFSYVLSRTNRQNLLDFVVKLVESSENAENIAMLLCNQFKIINGHMTHLAAQLFGELFQWFYSNDSTEYLNILSLLLQFTMSKLTLRNNEQSLMFNFVDILKVITSKSITKLQNSQNVDQIFPCLECFGNLLSNKYAMADQNVRGHLDTLVKECLRFQGNTSDVFPRLLAEHIKDPTKDMYYRYLSTTTLENRLTFMDSLHNVSAQMTGLLLLIFKKEIGEFLKSSTHSTLVMKLTVVMKNSNFIQKLTLAKLDVTQQQIILRLNMLKFPQNLDQLLPLLKICKNLSISSSTISKLCQSIKKINASVNSHIDNIFKKPKTTDDQVQFFNLHNFIKQVSSNHQLLPTVNFSLSFKQFIIEFEQSHNVSILCQEKCEFLYNYRPVLCNRINKIDQKYLNSRFREVRLTHLERMPQSPLISILKQLDGSEVNLQNQREVKRLLQQCVKVAQQQQITLLSYWLLGFSYTGFKLIDQTFIRTLSQLLSNQEAGQIILHHLHYINMKMCRKFQEALKAYQQENEIDEYMNKQSQIVKLLQEEYPSQVNYAAENAAFERVSKAVEQSQPFKNKFKEQLTTFLNCYFDYEFYRSNRAIQKWSEGDIKLVPPHPLHLQIMLRLMPRGYVAPMEILHHSSNHLKYFQNLKTQPWQTIWQKKGDDQNHLNLQNKLSPKEQQLYMHFLWKHILESDQIKRHKIFEHLRSQIKCDVQYLLKIHLNQVYLSMNQQTNKMHLLPPKAIVSFLHITNTFVKMLKMSLQNQIQYLAQIMVDLSESSDDTVRKTSVKSLIVVFREFNMFPELVQQAAQSVLAVMPSKMEQIRQSTVSSTPSLLKLLNEISNIPIFYNLFDNILVDLSQIYLISAKKEAIEVLNSIMLNLYTSPSKSLKSHSNTIFTNFSQYYTKQKAPNVSNTNLLLSICKNNINSHDNINEYLIVSLTKFIEQWKKQQKYENIVTLLISTLTEICKNNSLSPQHYGKVMQLIPMTKYKDDIIRILSNNSVIRPEVHQIALNLHSTVQKGLQILPDFDKMFGSFKQISIASMEPLQQQYILLNLIKFIEAEELSVKSAAISIFEKYLESTDNIGMFRRLLKIVLQMIKINNQDDVKFYSCVGVAGLFVQTIYRWNYDGTSERDALYRKMGLCQADNDKNFFKLVTSISQNTKLRALNLLKNSIFKVSHDSQKHQLPSLLSQILLPILQQMIFSKGAGNLSSSLSLVSTKLEGQLFGMLSQSQMRYELKRILSRLNFNDTHSKKNILVMKMLSEILDNIDIGTSVIPILQEKIKKQGIDVIQFKRQTFEFEDEDEHEEVLNQKYLKLDRKLADNAQEVQEVQDPLVNFMRKYVLVPLKSMLFYESKTDNHEKQSTSRLFLSVVLTKLLLRFPLDIFILEFNKIVSKLSRILKKKSKDSRDSARKCLAQIVKLTGAPLLHTVFREMSFHLNQNFQKHILCFSIHYIIEELSDQPETVDYSLPLILPCAFQDIFGQSSEEKELVDNNQLPTAIYELKKRKGFQILTLVARLISPSKLYYFIQNLKNELKKQLMSEEKLTKFEHVVNNVISGLSRNPLLTDSKQVISLLATLIKESSQKLRLFQLNEGMTQINIKTQLQRQRAVTRQQAYTLQPEAAKNGSIFRKVNRQIVAKRNTDQVVSNISNLHLSLVLMALKKNLITEQESNNMKDQLELIISFTVNCLQHNNNTILLKALKITGILLKWSHQSLVNPHRKKIATQVLSNLDRLTASEQELARESLSIINMIVKESAIPNNLIPPLLEHIKLHMEQENKEPYDLFKTLLLKHTKNPQIKRIVNRIKENMITTYREDTQKACKSVYTCYLRNYPLSQKDKNQQLMFLLKNIDYEEDIGRTVASQTLQQLLSMLNKTEIQHFAQIIFMTLLASYSSQDNSTVKSTLLRLQHNLLMTIDKSKVKVMVQQGICWASDEDQTIRLNGFNVFKMVQQAYPELINSKTKEISTFIKSQMKLETSLLLQYFSDRDEYQNRQKRLKDESSWKQIISGIAVDVQPPKPTTLPVCLELSPKLTKLHSDPDFLKYLSQSLCYPNPVVHQLAVNNSQIIVKQQLKSFWVYLQPNLIEFSNCMSELKHHDTLNFIQSLVFCNDIDVTTAILLMIRRTIHKCVKNKNWTALPYFGHAMVKIIQCQEAKSLLESDELKTIFIQIANKLLNQKDNIGQENYDHIEKYTEGLKQSITAAVFYEQLSKMKEERRAKMQEKKAELEQLAITDQQKYHKAKKLKK